MRIFNSLILILAVVFIYGSSSVSAQEPQPHWRKSTFYTPTLTTHGVGDIEVFHQWNVQRPAGNVAIRGFHFRIVDEDLQPVPLFLIYFHHIRLYNNNGTFFAVIGAESAGTPILLSDQFGLTSMANEKWHMEILLVDLIDIVRTSISNVKVEYTIWYTSHEDRAHRYTPVYLFHLDVTDIDHPEVMFYVPGDGGPGSIHKQNKEFSWNYAPIKIVYGLGHVHFGSIDVSLYDISNNQLICLTEPEFGDYGFVSSLSGCYPNYDVHFGQELLLQARYGNDKPLEDAMGFMCGYYYPLDDPANYPAFPWITRAHPAVFPKEGEDN